MGGRLSSNVKRHNVKNVTLGVDTVPETIENETVKSKVPSVSSSNLKCFGFNEIKTATRNFRPDNMVGEGSFGLVFKGWIDENSLTAAKPGTGMAIAVKRLNQEGLHGQKEWLAVVNSIGALHHPNLLRLIGYCLQDSCRFLAYEFMYFQSQPLPWSLRIKIAPGAAKGLAFLRSDEAKVIYGNFKTSEILLDSNYNAKLSGYGLAKEGLQGYSMLQLSNCSCSNSNKFYNFFLQLHRPDMNEVVKLLEQLQSSSEMEDLAARVSLKSYLAKFFMPIQAMYGPNRRQKNVNRISCATPT
ncbi:hypothetical protein ACE6H2_008467 [Prunus campanulata]